MKKASRTTIAVVLLGWLGLFAQTAASQNSCPTQIPSGTIIRIYPDEEIKAGKTTGPTLFTVTSDVRFFPNKPPLLPRGTKIIARMEQSKQAGRFWGRAKVEVVFQSILTPDFCEYAISAALIDAGKIDVNEDGVHGKGHPWRDLATFLFPPTTVYQVLRTPARGPKLVLDKETPLTIKLLEPVFPTPNQQTNNNAAAPKVTASDPFGSRRYR